MDKIKLAKLIQIQIQTVKDTKNISPTDLLALINEVLRDAEELAKEVLEDQKKAA